MNVLFVSQCSKNALSETRRILDQFAERRGERTWQTPITMEGLHTVRRMLRKTARKNTAVACHWVRGRDHSELVWVVGDAKRFNSEGAVPTNRTARDVLRARDENDWHTAEDIRLLSMMAALFHDFGKANAAFQKKLEGNKVQADAYRHEWVSLRLFQALVGKDSDEVWVKRLAGLSEGSTGECLDRLCPDGLDERAQSPFRDMGPLAQAVGWLIVTHHRVPQKSADPNPERLQKLPRGIRADWCGSRDEASQKEIKQCWTFTPTPWGTGAGSHPKADKVRLPSDSADWRKHVKRVAERILKRQVLLDGCWLDDSYVMHLSRLTLMLADHYYSGEDSQPYYGDKNYPLYANADSDTGKRKQRLDEHLIGVSVNAGRIVRTLPHLEQRLARIAGHKKLRRRVSDPAYRWQNKAFDQASALRERAFGQGFFGVNMASTGCGKTVANGRIMYALANPQQGARFSIALGLRTLTRQTGDVYRNMMHLGPADMAVLVGGGAIRALHERQSDALDRWGSESAAELLDQHDHVHYEGSLEDGPLRKWLEKNSDAERLLYAPVLVSTIDHLMPATEGTRGGRQIAPMLRLMTSDLILDEPDDFDVDDLPALSRLVHWAGLLGSRLLLSSATLPPALIGGLFAAYSAGRRMYQNNRGIPGQPLNVCCAWFDEFHSEAADCAESTAFMEAHRRFVDRRLAKLANAERRRGAVIQPLNIQHGISRPEIGEMFGREMHGHIHTLHRHHHVVDSVSGKRASFGLVRMAHIDDLFEVAKTLYGLGAEPDCFIHLCVYHARHPLLVRAEIEKQLDRILNRKQGDNAVFGDADVQEKLRLSDATDHIFVVLATAVAEVGRDHDYDWAVVEPSSMRSIVQLAGRVRRHRAGACRTPNIYLLDTNWAHIQKGGSKPAFCKPGFENQRFSLKYHRLTELLTAEQLKAIDASARIKKRAHPSPTENLVDLEHEHIEARITGKEENGRDPITPASRWWTTRAPLSAQLQCESPFRRDSEGRQRFALMPNEEDEIGFYQFDPKHGGQWCGNLKHDIELSPGPRIRFWGEPNYPEALERLADSFDMELADCARKYGVVDLPARGAEQGWNYHPALGFSRRR